MKRSAALAALSRDHHDALAAARRLRGANAEDLDAAMAGLHAFWDPLGRRHFEIEEQFILPALPEADVEWREATARVRDDHARIRAAVDDLHAPDDAEGLAAAHALGDLLHDHVRFEERHLFGLLEARLPEAELARIGEAVERAAATDTS